MIKPKASIQKPEKYTKNIYLLCENFSVEFHLFLKQLHPSFSSKHILNQVFRSSSSISANMSEAKNSLSFKSLAKSYTISLKEAHETLYWIKMLQVEYPQKAEQLNEFQKNLNEIIAILTSCVKKLRRSNA